MNNWQQVMKVACGLVVLGLAVWPRVKPGLEDGFEIWMELRTGDLDTAVKLRDAIRGGQ